MSTKYWLKSIGSNIRSGTDFDQVDKKWVAGHPWLLELVGSTRTMKDINRGDFVVFYAKGHQTIVAIARVSEPGDTNIDPERVSRTGADHALSEQALLVVPNAAAEGRAPSYKIIPGIEPEHIRGGRPIPLDEAQFLAGWRAIAESALPGTINAGDGTL